MKKWIYLGLVFLISLPMVLYFYRKETENTDDVIHSIYSVEDWLEFAQNVQEGNSYSMEVVKLCADLDFAGVENLPMVGVENSEELCFAGTLDGCGHRILNFTMQGGPYAGLFYNLRGKVCNLIVLGAQISAEVNAGAIAATAYGDAGVINCQVEASIEGNTVNGFIGNSGGTVRNCRGFEQAPSAEELNQGLGALSGSCQIDAWRMWEDYGNGPVLTGQTAVTLKHMTTWISERTDQMELTAYYSEQEAAWCFALPAGTTEKEFQIQLQFTDGQEIHMTGNTSEMTACEKDGVLYPIKFLSARVCPTLFIQTEQSDALQYLHQSKDNEIGGAYSLYNTDGSVMNAGIVNAIRSRGNHSWYFAKKGYHLRLSEAADLYGMGKCLNYVLLPGYRDNSLLTYKLTADLAQQAGMDYAPETRFVHLYIDGNYMGLYFLTQKIEIAEGRFELQNSSLMTEQLNDKKLKNYEQLSWQEEGTEVYRTWYDIPNSPKDLTGGYILEMDDRTFDADKSRFVSRRGNSVVLRSNPYASKEQVDYTADFWQGFEDALYAEDGYNEAGHHYTDYIDSASFADQWILYELDMEDSIFSSVYLYKDSDQYGDGKLHAVYPWDNEHGYVVEDKHVAESWFGATLGEDEYWQQFERHQDFREVVYQEWTEKFLPLLENVLESPEGLFTQYEIYAADGLVNGSRWSGCPYMERLEEIRNILKERKEFLTKALGVMDMQYVYFREKEGVFYGVTAEGEYIPLDGGTSGE